MTTETTLSSLRPRTAAYPSLSRSFSPVNYKNQRFLILDCPTDSTLPHYANELLARHVTDVVRVCEPTYSAEYLGERNIKVHEMYFKDGGVPPTPVVTQWLHLVEERFGPFPPVKKDGRSASTDNLCPPGDSLSTIAVHCVAGLGRAPVLVAIALIEAGMPALEAVEYIRKYRRGAFNVVQINFLDSYKRGQFKSSRPTLSAMGKGLLGRATPTPSATPPPEDKKGRPPSPKQAARDSRTPSPGAEAGKAANGAATHGGVSVFANGGGGGKGLFGGLSIFGKKRSPAGVAAPVVEEGHHGHGNGHANAHDGGPAGAGGHAAMVVN